VCVDYALSYTTNHQTCQPQLFLGMYDYNIRVTFMQHLFNVACTYMYTQFLL